MITKYNILSALLDYPTKELWDVRDEIKSELILKGLSDDISVSLIDKFLSYVHGFTTLRDWQADYSALFDTSSKTGLYLFDFVYGSKKERGQAMVDLKEEYLKAGLMPDEHELPDFLPMYLQYVANMDDQSEADAAMADISGVLRNMQQKFRQAEHPYTPLIDILFSLSCQHKKV